MTELSASTTAFYEPLEGGAFRSTEATAGPWDAKLQHGSPPIALLGRALERSGDTTLPDLRVARLSVEFLGPVPVADVTVATELLRPGKRVELWGASLSAAGRPALRATSWKVLAAAGRSMKSGQDEAPPAIPPPQPRALFEGIEWVGYGHALEWRFVSGSFTTLGPAVVWTRACLPLIAGEPLTPLQRVLLMLDSANGVSAELPIRSWTFVPVDFNVVLYRYPRGRWVGMDARTVVGDEGIGMTFARVFDDHGTLGRSVHTLFVAPR
jgi:Thioesterase-like superfamily